MFSLDHKTKKEFQILQINDVGDDIKNIANQFLNLKKIS